MLKKRRRKKKSILITIAKAEKKLIQGLIFLFFFSLIIVFVFGDHGLYKLYKIKKKRKLVQDQITQLRIEREKIKVEKNKLENNLDYIEKIAREKYRMVKPGEKIFKVIEQENWYSNYLYLICLWSVIPIKSAIRTRLKNETHNNINFSLGYKIKNLFITAFFAKIFV